jgi:hypothetical protein
MVEPGGDKHPMNTFRPDDQGRADVMMTGDFDGVAAVELSQEPGGGSPAPTSKPMGTATIAS